MKCFYLLILTSIIYNNKVYCQNDHNYWCPPVDDVTITSTINICKGETITGTTNFSFLNVTYNRFRNLCYQTCPSNDVKATDLSVSGPNILNIPDYVFYNHSPTFTAKPSESATYTMVMKRRCSTLAWDFSVQGVTERTWTEVINVTVTDQGNPSMPTYTVRKDVNNLDTYSIQTAGCTQPSLTAWSTLVYNGPGWFTGQLLEFETQIPVTVWAGCVKHKPVSGVSGADYCVSEQSSPLCIIPRPTISSSPDTIRCGKGIAALSASGCNGTVTWSNGMTGQSIVTDTLTQSTTFTAKCTGFCPLNRTQTIEGTSLSSETLSIIVKPKQPAPIISNINVDASSIKLTANGCDNGSSYVWEKQNLAGVWESIQENGKDIFVPAISTDCRFYRSACYKNGCQGDFGEAKIDAPNQLTAIKNNTLIKSKCPVKINWKQTKGCSAINDSATITVSKSGTILYSKKVKSTERSYEMNVSDFTDKADFYGLKDGDNLKIKVEAQLEKGGYISTENDLDIPVESEPTRIAGVTVLIPGLQYNGILDPVWKEYSEAARRKASPEFIASDGSLPIDKGATVYTTYQNNEGKTFWTYVSGSKDPNQEIILLYDWAKFSNQARYEKNGGYIEQACYETLPAILLDAKGDLQGNIIKDKKIEFDLHSRGTMCGNLAATRLFEINPEKKGYIDMVFMDSHPTPKMDDINSSSLGNVVGVIGQANDCNLFGCKSEGNLKLKVPCNVRNVLNFVEKGNTYEKLTLDETKRELSGIEVIGANRFEIDNTKKTDQMNTDHSFPVQLFYSTNYETANVTFEGKTFDYSELFKNGIIKGENSPKCKSGAYYTRLGGGDIDSRIKPINEDNNECMKIDEINQMKIARAKADLSIVNGNFFNQNSAGFQDFNQNAIVPHPYDSGDYSLKLNRFSNVNNLIVSNFKISGTLENEVSIVKKTTMFFDENKSFINLSVLGITNQTNAQLIITLNDQLNKKWIFKASNILTGQYSLTIPPLLKNKSGFYQIELIGDNTEIIIDDMLLSNDEKPLSFLLTKELSEIENVQSGNWNEKSTWSCYCVPTETDNVKIINSHRVTLTNQVGSQYCNSLFVEKEATFENNATLFIAKPN